MKRLCLSLVVLAIIYFNQAIQSYYMYNFVHKKELRHVAFLKIHKTGSSTVQNIFIRFGDHRNLTFMLGSVTNNECMNHSNCISFYNSITESNIVPPPESRRFDILCSHVIYNRARFQKYLPDDTKYISLVREPVSRLASAINHFKLLKNVSFADYASDPIKYDHFRMNNAMAYEFGFRKDLFPSAKQRHLNLSQKSQIRKYVRQLFEEFHIILVNERLYESLILMKRILNWKTTDILISSQMVKEHVSFDELDKAKLKTFLTLDHAIYNKAVRELESKIGKAGRGFQEEVKEFIEINKKVVSHCNSVDRNKILSFSATRWHSEFEVNVKFCDDLTTPEIAYLIKIRRKQYGTLETV